MIRFVHTADIHFGMENYGRIDPHTGIHSRLLDFNKALTHCIDTALEQQVDFFLFCGDAYKTAHPSPTQQHLLMKALLRLQQAGIPIVIIVGNHDHPLSFGKAHALDVFGDIPLDGFHVIAKPTIVNLHTKNGPINIVGIPWPTRNTIAVAEQHLHKSALELTEYIAAAVSAIIKNFAQQLDPQIPAVLAGHLTVSSGIFSGSEKRAVYGTDPLFLPSQLALPPFDYVALGHLHRHQNLNPQGYPSVVYAGSIERIDFGERKEDKGFCLVSIAGKGATSYEFIKVPTRPFIQVEVTLNSQEQHTEQIITALERHTLTDAIVKIIYHVPPGTKDGVDTNHLQRACRDAWYLVGIFPVHTPVTRERRTTMKVDMDLKTLLTTYFDSKPELRDQKDSLIEKALALQDDLDHDTV